MVSHIKLYYLHHENLVTIQNETYINTIFIQKKLIAFIGINDKILVRVQNSKGVSECVCVCGGGGGGGCISANHSQV